MPLPVEPRLLDHTIGQVSPKCGNDIALGPMSVFGPQRVRRRPERCGFCRGHWELEQI